MADRTGWFTHSALADMIAVSESTPGAMGVNMATYVGYTTAGLLGGIIATAGLIMPSLIIIMIIAKVLEKFRRNKYVDAGFYDLRPCSLGLMAAAGFLIIRLALLDLDAYSVSGAVGDLFHWKAWLLAAVLLILTNLVPKIKKIHPVFFILASAVVGIVFAF
jgi:chromate transporter